MRDRHEGHISGDVPYEHLPKISGRPAVGEPRDPRDYVSNPKPPTRSAMHPISQRPDWPEIWVVTTVPAEPYMHIQFGLDRAIPLLGYAVWSDGEMTPMFHWPQHGQIRAVRPRETGWSLRVIPPKNDPLTVDEPQEGDVEDG